MVHFWSIVHWKLERWAAHRKSLSPTSWTITLIATAPYVKLSHVFEISTGIGSTYRFRPQNDIPSSTALIVWGTAPLPKNRHISLMYVFLYEGRYVVQNSTVTNNNCISFIDPWLYNLCHTYPTASGQALRYHNTFVPAKQIQTQREVATYFDYMPFEFT